MHGRTGVFWKAPLRLWPVAVLLLGGCSLLPNPLNTTSGDKQLLLPEAREIRNSAFQKRSRKDSPLGAGELEHAHLD